MSPEKADRAAVGVFLLIVYGVTWTLCLILRPFASNSLPVMLAWTSTAPWYGTAASSSIHH
jgi:hypothetical protein